MGELKAPSFTNRTPLKPEEDDFEEWTRKRMGRRSDPTCVKSEPLPPKDIDIPCIELCHELMPSNVLIWGTACKQSCKVLVDTGAAITVISEKFFVDVLCATFGIQTCEKIGSIKTADGSKVPVIGAVRFPLLLGDSEYSCEATIVPGLAYSIVLGRDFLHNNCAVIDVKGCFVTFNGSNVVNFLKGNRPLVSSDITTITSYVIDANSETVIPARLEKLLPEPIIGVIESSTKLSDRYQLHIAASAVPVSPCTATPTAPISLPVTPIDDCVPSVQHLHSLQRQDKDLCDIIQYLEFSTLPISDNTRSLLLTIDSYYLDENSILCHLWTPGKRRAQTLVSQVVIPASLRHELLTACHDDPTAGHLSTLKTYEKVRMRYFWNGMFKDIEHWCHSCIDCAMKKVPRGKRKAPLLPIPVDGAFDRVAVDALGPFPATNDGNRYILVFSDYYTRWPEAFAVPSIEAPRVANILVNEILARHGSPRTLLSDRGSNFLSSVVKEVSKIMDTRKTQTTAYHPQTDGLVERFNGTLAEGLSMYVSTHQKDWDQHLPMILFAYRVSPNATTHESPFYLLYGREPRLPIDVSLLMPSENLSASVSVHRARIVQNLEDAQRIIHSNTQLAQQRMKEQYDKTAGPVPFEIGTKVWVYTPKSRKGLSKKLSHTYHGPYRVVSKLSPLHFRLRTLDNRPVSVPVHANRMKLYCDPSDRPVEPPDMRHSSPDLADSDLPTESFVVDGPLESRSNSEALPGTDLQEPAITRPEDHYEPQLIRDV